MNRTRTSSGSSNSPASKEQTPHHLFGVQRNQGLIPYTWGPFAHEAFASNWRGNTYMSLSPLGCIIKNGNKCFHAEVGNIE